MTARKLAALLLVLAGLLAYQNSYTVPFVFDDISSIVENPTIRHLWPLGQALSPPRGEGQLTVTGRPVINLSLALNYSLGGLAVRGYHVFNLTVHILAALTLYGIVRRTLLGERLRPRFGSAAEGLALATTLLWTVHPLQTEAVTYIVQRAESLVGLLYLLTLYCFIRGAESTAPKIWYLLTVAACALGMATKEVMVSAPLIVLLYDRTFVTGTFREAWRQRRVLYLGLASTWLLLGCVVASAGIVGHQAGGRADATWWRYALTQPNVILHYLRLALWPHPLCLDYQWPIAEASTKLLPPVIVVAALLAATVWACARKSAWGFLGAWVFLILAPTSSVLPLPDPAFEHRMYLPLAALIVALVTSVYWLGKHRLTAQPGLDRALGWGLSGVIACLFVSLTIQRNYDYRSETAIWQDTVEKRPQNFRAHNNLGVALKIQGRMPEAIAHYERALRLNPDYANAHYNLGVALARLGRLPEAVKHWEDALRIEPDDAQVHYNLGVTLAQLDHLPEAIGHYEQALRIKPDFAEAQNNLGIALKNQGQIPEAIAHYEQALRLNPDYAEAHYNLGVALARVGRLPEAVRHWEDALRIKPDDAQAHYNLGVALAQLGRLPEAIGHYEQALRIKPDFAEVQNNLGIALKNQGQIPEAIAHYEQALRIEPDDAQAHYNIGVALAEAGRVQEALPHFEQALRIKPDFAPARNALTQLQARP